MGQKVFHETRTPSDLKDKWRNMTGARLKNKQDSTTWSWNREGSEKLNKEFIYMKHVLFELHEAFFIYVANINM